MDKVRTTERSEEVFGSFNLIETLEGVRIPISRYNRGQKIVEWLFYAKNRLLHPGVKKPVKELVNALSDDARTYAIAAGLDVSASFDTVFVKLIEIFRFEGRNPTVWNLFSKRLDNTISAKDLAAEIYSMTVEIFNRSDKETLIQETALEAFLNALGHNLAKIMLRQCPSNIHQALEMLPKAREILAAQTSSRVPHPPKRFLSSKLYEYLQKRGKPRHEPTPEEILEEYMYD
ncbi:conserved hypothetical protein [Echinococcus multilocularis]|uniref:Uncharacterized protein n=1 Tax=Echinococcus multilocularis TaxID=6211 RepID=A0A087VZK4_ECHMU|nr:conserved hypothetical protein [Echinococcus multilocularis]